MATDDPNHVSPDTEPTPVWHRFFPAFAAAIISCGVLLVAIEYTNQQRDATRNRAEAALEAAKKKAAHEAAIKQWQSDITICRRLNVLASNVNDSSLTLTGFLTTARKTRLHAAKLATTEADRKLNLDAARIYKTLIDHYHTTPVLDCAAVYPKP